MAAASRFAHILTSDYPPPRRRRWTRRRAIEDEESQTADALSRPHFEGNRMNQGTAPLAFGDVVAKGSGIFRDHFSLLMGLALTVSIPSAFGPVLLLDSPPDGASAQQFVDYLLPEGLLYLLLIFCLNLAASGAMTRVVAGVYTDQPLSFSEAYGDGLAKLFLLGWTAICVAVLVGIGLLFLIVPGVYLALLFAFTTPVVMLEEKSGPAALGRSRQLAEGNLLRILGLFLLMAMVSMTFSLLAVFVPADQEIARATASALLTAFSSGWFGAIFVALYFDIHDGLKPGPDLEAFRPPPRL